MSDLGIFLVWLFRSGHEMLSWWLLVTLAGLAAWPLVFRLLPRLADRGYNLARLVGMLAVAYTLWILGSLGFLHNTPGSAVFAWLIVLVVGLATYFARRECDITDMGAWLRENWRVVLAGELVFALLFFGWAIVRAYDPSLGGTEKPMEMAFVNAIRRAETFPPHDPWMSGYAISYYYFGYVMIAALANLSGVASGVAFNLSVALFFALAGIGAYSVVFNLVHSRRRIRVGFDQRTLTASLVIALLGPLFLVILGNLGGVVQLAWSQRALPASFFDWLNIQNYEGLPQEVQPHAQWRFWWWFQSSRVIRDVDLSGAPIGLQPIDEFPNFSFLLGDLHPHVLALPFSLLAIGLAFNLVRTTGSLDRAQFAFYALCLGGLIFLNLLDGPLYMAFVVGAEVLRRLIREAGRLTWRDWLEAAGFGVGVGALGLILYLPFFIGFRSQAGGLLPNPLYPTRFSQFFVMFGPFLVIIAIFLLVEWWRGRGHLNWELAIALGAGVLAGLIAAMVMLGLVAAMDPVVQGYINVTVSELGGPSEAFMAVLNRRLSYAVTSVVLAGIVVVGVARLFGRVRIHAGGEASLPPQATGWTAPVVLVGLMLALALTLVCAANGVSVLALALALTTSLLLGVLAYLVVQWALETRYRSADAPTRAQPAITYTTEAGFALLLIAAGAALTLLPDYVYVVDNFRSRLNTVFKFYYQAWAMWSVACAYATYSVSGEWAAETRTPFARPVMTMRWVVRGGFAVMLLIALATMELATALWFALAVLVTSTVSAEALATFVLTATTGKPDDRPPLKPLAARLAFGAAMTWFVAAGLVYPVASVMTETNRFRPDYTLPEGAPAAEVVINRPDLDGERTMFGLPGDEAVIHCLSAHVQGDDAVVAEAVGGQYSQYARVATLSGISTVLGWPGHEAQWRGATYGEIAGSREYDIKALYTEPFLENVRPIIERYGIDYIFVGSLERRDFGAEGLAKFQGLDVVCENESAVVYATDRLTNAESAP